MINFRKYKNLTYIITIFSLIIFVFSIITSIIITDYKNNNALNALKTDQTKYFKFEQSQKISINSLIQVLSNYKKSNIYLEYNPVPKYLATDTLFGKAVYYNYNLSIHLAILEGKNFTLKQINSNEKLILVGKDLKKYIITENGINYFTIDDDKYRVIGIMGSTNKTGYDDTFFVNMKSMNSLSDKRATWSLNVSNKEDLNNIINQYTALGVKNSAPLEFTKSDMVDTKITFSYLLQNYPDFIYIFGVVFGFGILNLIIIVYFWIDKSIKEIGIRKAYGATNIDIGKLILIRYETSILISLMLGLTLHYIFKRMLSIMFPSFSFEIYIENVVIAAIVFMIIGLLVAIIPLIRARKFEPIIIMKGKLR
jgi:ABC-type antimicrobial peptide transport system permease subunit